MEISPIGKAKIHRLYSYYLYHITYFLVKKNIIKSENFGSKPQKKRTSSVYISNYKY